MGSKAGGRPRALIVGGAGYFGARLSESLATEMDVTVTYRSKSPARASWLLDHQIEGIRFDSGEQSELPAGGDFDILVNLAMPGASEAARAPEELTLEQALTTSQACLEFLKKGRACRLIHFSTFHVYGGAGREKYLETDVPAPSHPYGRAHLACEELLLPQAAQHPIFVVRPSNMVGRPAHADLGDHMKLLFLDLCRQAVRGAIVLGNDGVSHRDFLPFPDAINAIRLLLQAPLRGERLFNLAAGRSIQLREVARIVEDAATGQTGRRLGIEFGEGTDPFREPFSVNVSRLEALGWRPVSRLEDEAAAMVRLFQGES